jgi:hypothetical protein
MSLLEGSKTIGGIRLRPFTFGTLDACERLKLTLFTSTQGAEGLEQTEVVRQMVAFAWVQSTPPESVVDAFMDGTAARQIELFKHSLEIGAIDALVAEVSRIGEAVKSVSVEVQAKPQKGSEETPPPN